MPVPNNITDCDTNAANNSPQGTESAKGSIDNYLRTSFSFIRQLHESLQTTTATANAANAAKIPAGSAMLFQQTTAPTGWTKITTHDNKALRIVSGAAASGGTIDFTTAFTNKSVSGSVGGTTLSNAQMPPHKHQDGTVDGSGVKAVNSNAIGGTGSVIGFALTSSSAFETGSQGGGNSHNHSFTGSSIDLTVKYVDAIIATKDA